MERQWILVADAAHARILSTKGSLKKAVHVQSFDNDKARLHGKDFTTDKPGRVFSGNGLHAANTDEGNPKEHVVQEFARKLAGALDAGRQHGAYDKITLVAPPHLLGLIKQSLDVNTARLVSHTIQKDLAHEPTKAFISRLEKLMH
jgi:protein required for attachment to host cells